MSKQFVPVIAGLILAGTLFLLLIGVQIGQQAQSPSEPQSAATLAPEVTVAALAVGPPTGVPLPTRTIHWLPTRDPSGTPGPTETPTPVPPTLTFDEAEARGAMIRATAIALGGRSIQVSGPATKGSIIAIAGRRVQLPPDTFVEHYIIAGQCTQPPCIQLPAYIIKRGSSTIHISMPTGEVAYEDIAPGEEGAFDFLRAALQ